ncbi:hypothetical protein Taro_004222 [Colocasia esculenta]|uniref:ceramide glucosyltransferase n=1 Tax=Colocasia esculenta TaxID=4460 RepID=A0A843THH7_COLES|nr:hypothetical protein [Colocasia esculenta]
MDRLERSTWADPVTMMKAMMATLMTKVIQLRLEVRRVPVASIVDDRGVGDEHDDGDGVDEGDPIEAGIRQVLVAVIAKQVMSMTTAMGSTEVIQLRIEVRQVPVAAIVDQNINDLEHSAQSRLPRVSVIMPLKGFGEHNLQNWRSQIASLYAGPLEFLFVVESVDDLAYHVVSRLISEFQVGVQKMHKDNKCVLFLDDDVRLHPGTIGALTAEMEKNPKIFIQTGYPLDLPSGSLGSYCIYEYHMGAVILPKDPPTVAAVVSFGQGTGEAILLAPVAPAAAPPVSSVENPKYNGTLGLHSAEYLSSKAESKLSALHVDKDVQAEINLVVDLSSAQVSSPLTFAQVVRQSPTTLGKSIVGEASNSPSTRSSSGRRISRPSRKGGVRICLPGTRERHLSPESLPAATNKADQASLYWQSKFSSVAELAKAENIFMPDFRLNQDTSEPPTPSTSASSPSSSISNHGGLPTGLRLPPGAQPYGAPPYGAAAPYTPVSAPYGALAPSAPHAGGTDEENSKKNPRERRRLRPGIPTAPGYPGATQPYAAVPLPAFSPFSALLPSQFPPGTDPKVAVWAKRGEKSGRFLRLRLRAKEATAKPSLFLA